MMNKQILITGLMGSGKSIVADRLVKEYNYPSLSMATWIKETVCKHYGLTEINKSMEVNDIPMRTILQNVGEAMRRIDPDWHIHELMERIRKYNIKSFVIDDIRFKHEYDVLNEHFDCVNIKIECNKRTRLERIILRDLVVPTESQLLNSSEIEVDLIPSDYVINNDGSIYDLYDQVDQILRRKIYESTKI